MNINGNRDLCVASANPHAGDVSVPLAPVESSRLSELEAVVTRGRTTFLEVGVALSEIRDRRLYRETHAGFGEYCRDRFGFERAHAYRHIDSARVATILSPFGDGPANEGQARELIPLLRDGDDQAVVEVFNELRAKYGDKVTAEKIRSVVRNRMERTRREEVAKMVYDEAAFVGVNYRLIHRDLAQLTDADVASASVSAIITDPPYADEFLPLYNTLGSLAARVLEPGGSLLCMTRQSNVLDVADRLRSHLDYRWLLSYVLPGSRQRFWPRQIYVGFKPVLWFTHGELGDSAPWVPDIVTSGGRDKRFHEWGQSVGGFSQLVDRFTAPGDTVLDPFVGGGTTGVACIGLGRNFIGVDIDADAIATSAERLRYCCTERGAESVDDRTTDGE